MFLCRQTLNSVNRIYALKPQSDKNLGCDNNKLSKIYLDELPTMFVD